MTTTAARARESRWTLLPAAVAALVALALNHLVPLVSPLLIALLIGAVLANTRLATTAVMSQQARATRTLLRIGVVLLGLKLPASDIVQIGPPGLVVIVATVTVTYVATIVIGDLLRLERGLVTLLAAGFSICGAAAIAAVEDSARATRRDVALAVAMVTLYGSAMIALVPWLSHVLGLSTEQGAIWAGASIHEVAQVAAAASILGTSAIAVAMTVKLGRIMLLAPVHLLASRRGRAGATGRSTAGRTPLVPWFVIGFALAVALRSSGLLGSDVLEVTDLMTSFLLAAGMFGLGVGIRLLDLWPVPPRALALATISTLVAAGTALGLILALT
ncbi:YeiH family protein [Aeromicrobium sp. CTD01-1L150]|uniref:YeiH family protein n=1 Tax=Aeromicrobium sp. CTD01-1L150 TaxID=3341830 RepID=UPI0035C0A68B